MAMETRLLELSTTKIFPCRPTAISINPILAEGKDLVSPIQRRKPPPQDVKEPWKAPRPLDGTDLERLLHHAQESLIASGIEAHVT